jgi:hypothetical protein
VPLHPRGHEGLDPGLLAGLVNSIANEPGEE